LSQAEIKDIYAKVQINREQISKRALEQKEATMESQLTRIFGKYFQLLQDPKISVAVQDEAKRDISRFLDDIQMNSDHDVIMALTNMEITKQYKEKLKQ
jgi:hypothetical protein